MSNDVRYVVVFGRITLIKVKNSTPKGVRDIQDTFYQNDKVFSGYDSPKEYRTQRITSNRGKAEVIAKEQCDAMLQHLRFKADKVFKECGVVTTKRYL